jgi:geranylgeranyl diphosphate synthase, type III
LQKRPTTLTLEHCALSYPKINTSTFEYTRGVLKNLENQVRNEIERLEGNPALKNIIEALVSMKTSNDEMVNEY